MSENLMLSEKDPIRKIIEIVLRIGLLLLLIYWCFSIVKPFMDILIWAVIFAVALFPAYDWLQKKLGSRKKVASLIIVVLMLLVILLPGVLFARSLYDGVTYLKNQFEVVDTIVPPAPEKISTWPFVGPFLYEKWNWVSLHLSDAVKEYTPQLKTVVIGFLSSAASASFAFLKFIVAIVVAGLFLINSEKAGKLAHGIFNRLIGEKGSEFASMAEKTIRTVVKGILGVAFIQSVLFGIGMVVAGVPAAGLWVILSLILGIIQVGIFLVVVPVVIYVFASSSTFTAVAFLIWCIIISPLDNILKPILLGRGAVVPMAIIFIGAIGGFIFSGLVGLFTGAIIFSVGYKLFLFWLDENKIGEAETTESNLKI
jgi:predicted PurR-regulated permease PerM